MSLPIWSKYGRIYSLNQHVACYREDYNCLLLSEREIGSFAKISEKFGYFHRRGGSDSSAAELMEIDRILAKLKLTKTKFHTRIFSIFDASESGLLSFHHFFLIVWNLCTIDILSLGYLLFDIYDLDRSQTFEFDEVRLLISELCDGVLLNNSDAKVVNERLDELNYLAVSPDTFVGLCRTYPVILTPLRNVQQSLKTFFKISKDFWEYQMRNRQMMTDSEYVPLERLLDQQAAILKITRYKEKSLTHAIHSNESAIHTAVRDTSSTHLPLPHLTNQYGHSQERLPPLKVISYGERKRKTQPLQDDESSKSQSTKTSSFLSQDVSLPSFRDYVSELRIAIQRSSGVSSPDKGIVYKDWQI